MNQAEMELLALSADQEIDEVLCPVCQASNLLEKDKQIVCNSCDFLLDSGVNLKDLGYLINRCVNIHSATCKEPADFLMLPENNNTCLYLFCDKCSTWTLIA